MTDAAIAADSGAAPVDVGGAPINENPAGFTQPLGSQIPPDAQADAQPAKPASLDDSIDRAIAKSAEKEAAKAAPEKVAAPAKEPQPRVDGKFAPKEATKPADAAQQEPTQRVAPAEQTKPALPSHTASEAPARFSQDAKTEWATAPESVRRETERAIKELTDGFAKHKQGAEAYEGFRELDEIARSHGHRSGADVFRSYYEMEQALQKDPVAGLDNICQKLGFSLRDIAAHVLQQPADQQASQSDATIRELKQTIAQLQQQVGTVQQTFQQQQETAVGKEVTEFASAHPRFEELSDDITFFLKTRCPGDLQKAYELAERLNPAPAKNEAAQIQVASSAASVPEVQPSKGQKSINGAPSTGSTPGRKRVAKSLDDALDSAFASAG